MRIALIAVVRRGMQIYDVIILIAITCADFT
jgi:hypothetical protein